jgi:phosphate-selective porin OprO and OprP
MKTLLPLLLASAALATPATAQTTTDEDLAALRAQIEMLQSKVAELEAGQAAIVAKVEAAPAPAAKISWKGAPVIEGDGWSFKPRGRLQYDVGYVGRPAVSCRLGVAVLGRPLLISEEGARPNGVETAARYCPLGVSLRDGHSLKVHRVFQGRHARRL